MKKNFNLGERVQSIRKASGLSQEELALRADITPTYMGQIERNIKNPTIRVLERICEALDVSLADFFSEKETSRIQCPITTQIVAQLRDCSDNEKNVYLKILKDIKALRR
ncbi:helix-turn-helix domain-containing protein [Eubacterium xylanophilum]|uniref:helix-turn-helix domain-containing protein n=1 Tax=Eubacterium xylanophilum TaxID=39497 RepID=UPI00047EF248|nr:helix-turn-helix transcriptional regulator [Eubacterium xylanophilum]